MLLLCAFIGMMAASCSQKKKAPNFRVAFSQCGDDDQWRKSMLAEMRRELSFHPELELVYRQASDNSARQIADVRQFLSEGIDLLIISPNEALPLTPVVEEVFNQGIPVIIVDRKIATGLYTNYIGADNFQIGKMAGEYVAALLKGSGNVVQIGGLPGSSPAIERDRGFRRALSSFPDINLAPSLHGNWVKNGANEAVMREQAVLAKADLVFAHNDVMALGVREAAGVIGKNDVRIIGVDALPGPDMGMAMVAGKTLTASLLYPTGGAEAIQNAAKILSGLAVGRETILQTLIVDSSNVRMMKLQSDKMLSQQHDIQQQQHMIAEQRRIYNNQRTFVYVLICSLGLVIIFAALLYYSWQVNKKINRKLSAQNREIMHKSELLIEMSSKAQAAHDARVNFFTNISHEFRTPLTLLLGPLDEMLSNTKMHRSLRQQLTSMRKNALRMMRLVGQLMDFRKVEFNKWKIRAAETEIISFTQEIVRAFQEVAVKRNIDCRLLTSETLLPVWIDNTMMDKVLFNLLSNAFKFTSDNGSVIVKIRKDNDANCAVINVEDSGVGISRDDLDHIFDLFFQGDFESHKGSGIGLALTRELLALHNGRILASSVKGKGTTFTIMLPLGKDHFSDDQLLEESLSSNFVDDQGRLFTSDLYPTLTEIMHDDEKDPQPKEATVLVVEDNPDLRKFISANLRNRYQVIEAANGHEGLKATFDALPDIIISDVMMPGKDGMALVRELKEDVRTSHIPVILLSARIAVEDQIEGLRNLADAYFTKPFNFALLSHTIKSLLANRKKAGKFFSSELPADAEASLTKADRHFIYSFKAIVEGNIGNDRFTIDDICSGLHISKVHLHRKVRSLLQTSVNDYILKVRIEKARYFLRHEEMSVSEVAFQTGFSSPAYFSTVFKSRTGVSPSDYKDKKK